MSHTSSNYYRALLPKMMEKYNWPPLTYDVSQNYDYDCLRGYRTIKNQNYEIPLDNKQSYWRKIIDYILEKDN